MSRSEQCERIRIDVSGKDFLEMNVLTGEKRGMGLVEHRDFAGVPEEGMGLLRTVMVAHLIAPFFPKIVETNFGVTEKVFIDELYKYYDYRPPRLETVEEIKIGKINGEGQEAPKIRQASAHSGGLDSAYRLALMKEKEKSVVAVHLRNLNRKGNHEEYVASEKQCEAWKVPFELVRLRNNSKNDGFDTMRTRDFLLAIVAAVTVYPYGVSKLYVEGDMVDDPAKGHFSENTLAWKMFNKLIAEANLKMEVEGIDVGDIETVGEVIKLEKSLGIDIIPLVQNCFSATYQLPNSRRKWVRVTPEIAKNSSEHWCGSCLKCRRMTLGRLCYHDPRLENVPKEEIEYFVKDTYNWLRIFKHNGDLVSKSFLKHLENLKKV